MLQAQCLNQLGSLYLDTGELRKGVGYLEQALPLKKTLSDPNSYATSLYNLANAHAKLDEYGGARAEYSEALAIFQRTALAVDRHTF